MVDWQNGFEAILDDRVLAADTYIKMTPVPDADEGRLVLEDTSKDNYEIIYYTSKDANGVYTTSGGARDEDSNSTGIHPKGARVRQNITAQDMRAIRDHSANIASLYSAMPTAAIIPYAGATAPSLWLIADGTAVSRATYAALFTAIGTTFGPGNGTTTFNLPNMKGRSAFGKDAAQTEFDTLGETGGQKTVGAHIHNTFTFLVNGAGTIFNRNDNNGDAITSTDNASNGTNGDYITKDLGILNTGTGMAGVNNLNPYITLNYIIRT